MAAVPKNLGDTLNGFPAPTVLPLALPLSHLSVARWFDQVASSGHLEPRLCKVFGEDLLYLFYGGVFHRANNQPTKNVAELPIAFLFSPNLLRRVLRFFPFDTGALAAGRFGTWSTSLSPLDNFKVNGDSHHTISRKMIYHLFNDNKSYLHGNPDPNLKSKPYPLPELFDFYSADMTGVGVDHRQCIIECQTTDPIPMKDDLLWVGFPESMTLQFAKLCEWMAPSIPQYYAYESHKITVPSEMTAKLEEIAKAQVVERYIALP